LGARLLAVCRDPVLPVTLPGHRNRTEDATVVAVPLRVTLAPGRQVRVPGWLVEGQASTLSGNLPGVGSSRKGDAVQYSFRVPLGPHGGTVTSLRLQAQNTMYGSGPGSAKATEVWVRDPRTQTWQQISQQRGNFWMLPQPEQFVGPEGRVEVAAVLDNAPEATLTLDATVNSR